MPNQNQPDPNQGAQQNSGAYFPQDDLPPIPPAFQGVTEEVVTPNEPSGPEALQAVGQPTGSSAPPDVDISSVIGPPKKKFGTGKIIATILGLFLLVGGVGAGIALTQQPQLFEQKADELDNTDCYLNGSSGPRGYFCAGCDNKCRPDSDFKINGQTVGCNYFIQKCQPIISGTDEGGAGQTIDACNSSGCTVPANTSNCFITRYHCDRNTDLSQGCQDTVTGNATSGSLGFIANCGAEQIDILCVGERDFVSKTYTNPCDEDTSPPDDKTPTPAAPYCTVVKAYDSSWTALTNTDLSALTSGSVVNFCVNGSAPSGTFSKAQFTINGVQQAETTTLRTGSTDYCQSYTILSTDTTVTVTAKIYHSTLGWF